MQACARHVGHIVGTVAEPVSHDDLFPGTGLLKFILQSQAGIIFVPVVARVEVVGFAVENGIDSAGRRGRRHQEECEDESRDAEWILHASMIRSKHITFRPTTLPMTV